MDDSSTPDYNGKKIFFIQPNSVIQKELVTELIRQEYEVLLVPEVAQAKKIFSRYPDCLAFLNLDEGLSEEGWENFVREVQADPAFAQVKLGIMTYNPDQELAQKYLMDFQLPCGYIKLTLKLEESTSIVLKVLDANEARGRRKYLRVHCGDNTKLNLKLGDSIVEGKVIDLSSVGMACVLNSEKDLALHSMLEKIQLQLKGNLVLVNGIVMGSRPLDDGGRAYVILFDPKTPDNQRAKSWTPESQGRVTTLRVLRSMLEVWGWAGLAGAVVRRAPNPSLNPFWRALR